MKRPYDWSTLLILGVFYTMLLRLTRLKGIRGRARPEIGN